MTQRGEEQTRQIHKGLICPACEYSLRGLPGNDVICPECGGRINIPQLIASKWTGPWYSAPLYNMLAMPLAWAMIASMAAFAVVMGTQRGDPTPASTLGAMAVVVIGWIVSMLLVSKRFGSEEGMALALLLHFCIPAYVLGLAGGVGFGIAMIVDLQSRQPITLVYHVPMFLVSVGAVVLGRLIERFVARRCIRRYLQRRTAGAAQPS